LSQSKSITSTDVAQAPPPYENEVVAKAPPTSGKSAGVSRSPAAAPAWDANVSLPSAYRPTAFDDIPDSFQKEPMLLLDTTGSMNYSVSEKDDTPRKTVIHEAISIIVGVLSKQDSQAGKEQTGGGLRTVTFAGGDAVDIDDLNPTNLRQKWSAIRWRGGTCIMPGWTKLMEIYKEEFGSRPVADQPVMMALVITDGEAEDRDEFEKAIMQAARGNVYVTLAVVGYGEEHDAAVAGYQAMASRNRHLRCIPFGSETDPRKVASAMLKMIE